MKFANGLNSNYPGVSFARFSRFAAFFTFVVFAGSCRPSLYALPHIAKTPDPRKETEVMAEEEWK